MNISGTSSITMDWVTVIKIERMQLTDLINDYNCEPIVLNMARPKTSMIDYMVNFSVDHDDNECKEELERLGVHTNDQFNAERYLHILVNNPRKELT